MARIEILDNIKDALVASGLFKKVYRNRIPEYSTVNNHPSVGIAWTKEGFLFREAYKKSRYVGEITVMFYTKQSASNKDEDTISPLLDKLYCIINDRLVCSVNGVISVELGEVKRDMGTLHPLYLAEVKLMVTMQDKVTTANCN